MASKPVSWATLAANKPKKPVGKPSQKVAVEKKPAYLKTKSTCITTQPHDIITAILKFVPFVDQITMWQTGNLAWRRLYKASIQKSATTLVFDEDFCRKLLSCYLDPGFKIPEDAPETYVDADGFLPAGKTTKSIPKKPELKPASYTFPTGIISKIPKWIRFNKFICNKVDHAVCTTGPHNYTYNILYIMKKSLDGSRSCISELYDLLSRSESTLTSVYTNTSTRWMFELFQKRTNGKKNFHMMADFQCNHVSNCYCHSTSLRLPNSGLFVMGIGHFGSEPKFYIPDAETVTTVRLSDRAMDYILNYETNFKRVISFIRDSVPNLESIEMTCDLGSHIKLADFSKHAKELQILKAKNIFVKPLHTGSHSVFANSVDHGEIVVKKLIALFGELGFGFGFRSI
jgi:hypothetical protein